MGPESAPPPVDLATVERLQAELNELRRELASRGPVPVRDGRRRVRRGMALVLAVAVAALPTAVALAAHVFPDVVDGTTHAQTIERIAKAGITAGCNNTANYCPNDPVTRAQMATFLNRSLGRVATSVGAGSPVAVSAGQDISDWYLVGSVSITVPGATNTFNPNQFVKVDASASLFDPMNAAAGCRCEFVLGISKPGATDVMPVAFNSFKGDDSADWSWSLAGGAVFAASPGTATYKVWMALENRTTTSGAATFPTYLDSAIASTFAFGPTGGNTGLSSIGSASTSREIRVRTTR